MMGFVHSVRVMVLRTRSNSSTGTELAVGGLPFFLRWRRVVHSSLLRGVNVNVADIPLHYRGLGHVAGDGQTVSTHPQNKHATKNKQHPTTLLFFSTYRLGSFLNSCSIIKNGTPNNNHVRCSLCSIIISCHRV